MVKISELLAKAGTVSGTEEIEIEDAGVSNKITLARILDRARHTGTQLAATISDFNAAVRANRLDQLAAPTGSVDVNAQRVINSLDPIGQQDLATKNYVDLQTPSNQLTNGGLDFWQRGSGPFSTNGTYGPDRWLLQIAAPDTLAVSLESTVVDPNGSTTSAKCVVTHSAGGGTNIYQKLEESAQLRGRTVTFSARIYSTVAAAVNLNIQDIAGGVTTTTTQTVNHPGTGWVTMSATRTIPANATQVAVFVSFALSGTFYVDNAVLAVSPGPVAWTPLPYADEFTRCQRYYETGSHVYSWYAQPVTYACFTIYTRVPFKVQKGGIPTVTMSNSSKAWLTQINPAPATPVDSGGAASPVATTSFQRYLAYCGQWNYNGNGQESFDWVAEYNP